MLVGADLKNLYEVDEVQWLQEMVKLLKAQQFQSLDVENLLDNGKR